MNLQVNFNNNHKNQSQGRLPDNITLMWMITHTWNNRPKALLIWLFCNESPKTLINKDKKYNQPQIRVDVNVNLCSVVGGIEFVVPLMMLNTIIQNIFFYCAFCHVIMSCTNLLTSHVGHLRENISRQYTVSSTLSRLNQWMNLETNFVGVEVWECRMYLPSGIGQTHHVVVADETIGCLA